MIKEKFQYSEAALSAFNIICAHENVIKICGYYLLFAILNLFVLFSSHCIKSYLRAELHAKTGDF